MAFQSHAQTFVPSQNNKLDKAEAIRMLDGGSSTITGQVFARDNQGGLIPGVSILNTNEKQYARAGTEVVLMPYTAYFREYLAESKKQHRRGKSLLLPNEVVECMKFAKTGGRGKYIFDKLTEGKYFIYTSFGYVHQGTQTDVVGQRDHYVNGVYQGSSDLTNSYGVTTGVRVFVEKIITIDKDGEVKEVNLKRTK
ncbi:hypothetical protein GCM10022409_45620 [Hymenobacter glaciei]|uniref:Uncharacterized protein n=2 Tax=Hymenobacter glaciei TaxID=877209 RepID=A0ABP7UUV6_9BACT